MLPRCGRSPEVQWAKKLDMLTAPGPQGLGSLRSNSQLDLFQSRKNTPSTMLRLQQLQQPDQQQEAYVSSFDKKVYNLVRPRAAPGACSHVCAASELLCGNANNVPEL